MVFINEIKSLRAGPISEVVGKRLKEFSDMNERDANHWFSELCFCILTSNSKARTAMAIQGELGYEGFMNLAEGEVSYAIRKHKHRFHNTKARHIIEARKFGDIKEIIKELVEKEGEIVAREWLVENVKGLGYKESSHFLRNIGYTNVSILDRHILNLMAENRIIDVKPKSLNKKNYTEIEAKFNEIAKELNMNSAELDLYMWYMKTGEVLK